MACRCGKQRMHPDPTDDCLSPADRDFVRQVKAAYDQAVIEQEDGPWWHQAAGKEEAS